MVMLFVPAVMIFPAIAFIYWRHRQDNPQLGGSVLAGTGRVKKVQLLHPSIDQRDWYRVTVQLTITEMPGSKPLEAPARRFEFEPNDRPVVGDTWSVEVSATHPSRYRVVRFPRRVWSHGAEQPVTRSSGPALDSRIGEHDVRGPVLTGTAQALTVQRITQPDADGGYLYHYVITLRVKIPGQGPYDVIRMYRDMQKIRPYEGDAWEVQVSESDPLKLAVLFGRQVPNHL
jgi:hypothetical protein